MDTVLWNSHCFAHGLSTVRDFRGSFLHFSNTRIFLLFSLSPSGPAALLPGSLSQWFFPSTFFPLTFIFLPFLSHKHKLFSPIYALVALWLLTFCEPHFFNDLLRPSLKDIQLSQFISPTIIFWLARFAGYFCLSLLGLLTSRRECGDISTLKWIKDQRIRFLDF